MDTIMHLNNGEHLIDRWEILRILKRHLNYSWKKPQIRPVDAFRPDVVLNWKVFRCFMRAAVKWGARFIFVDESFFNPRHLRYKSWISKDFFCPVLQHYGGFGVASICALTDEGALYSVLRKGTNSAREILLFFIDLEKKLMKRWGTSWQAMRKKLIVVFDNAAIHITDEVQSFFACWGILAVTLSQYSPELNPLEKAFGIIKTRLTWSNLVNW